MEDLPLPVLESAASAARYVLRVGFLTLSRQLEVQEEMGQGERLLALEAAEAVRGRCWELEV